SLMPVTQQFLLDQRVGVQAMYRDLTRQVPGAEVPPVALVQIDEASIRRDERIAEPEPINRTYLASLIDHLTQQNASLIGIDYLLDRRIGSESALQKALQKAVSQQQTWFVFGTLFNQFDAEGIFTAEESGVAQRTWSMQGYVSVLPAYMTLPYPDENCQVTCPFGYLLALIQSAKQASIKDLPQPALNNQRDLRTQFVARFGADDLQNPSVNALQQAHLSPLSAWAYENLGIVWLDPLIDYSIPPDRIYDRIAAWRVIEHSVDAARLNNQVVLIGGGEYIDGEMDDQYPLPAAIRYWRDRLPEDNNAARFPAGKVVNTPTYLPKLTGAEIHAYIVHHLLTQRLVIPIPDLWLLGLAAIIGKTTTSIQRTRQQKKLLFSLMGLTAGYGLISLQLYISASILL
ncbi:MAG TPA: CHASE2 domain-containing protein, partial [Allocoleopsis sp.]